MADEQTPQSDLVDDAIRRAEHQLEAKLEALRMSALGEPTQSRPDDDVAVLRPTGSSTAHGDEPSEPVGVTGWQEAAGDDVTFTPAPGSAAPSTTELYVPEADDRDEVGSAHETLSATVTDLTPMWDEDEESFTPPPAAPIPSRTRPTPTPQTDEWATTTNAPTPGTPQPGPVTPSDAELEFWAHTRTALRNLQRATNSMSAEVAQDVSSHIQRIVHDEFAPTDAVLQDVRQQLQHSLPKLAERLESAIDQAMVTPSNGLRQLRDELPAQLDRASREQREALRADLHTNAETLHATVQHDVAQLEQTIASNVTRLTNSTLEAVSRVEQDVESLGDGVTRIEQGVQGEFARAEEQLRRSLDSVEQTLRDELGSTGTTVRKIDVELPNRFDRVEQALLDQVQSTQHEITRALSKLVDSHRVTADRIGSLTSIVDASANRRTDDVELIVDTVTTGWEGLAGAVKALYEQGEENGRRIASIEQRLVQIRDVERAVEQSMNQFQAHIQELKPAPIVVTVSHAEAEVNNTTQPGWSTNS